MDYLSLKSLLQQLTNSKLDQNSVLHLPIVVKPKKVLFTSAEDQQVVPSGKEWNLVNLSFGSPYFTSKQETQSRTLGDLIKVLRELEAEDSDAAVTFDDHVLKTIDFTSKIVLGFNTEPLTKTLAKTSFNPFRTIDLDERVRKVESLFYVSDHLQKKELLTQLQSVLPESSGVFIYKLKNPALGKQMYIVTQVFHDMKEYDLEYLVTRHIIMKSDQS
uniref:Uncharacterized protein n=1 Tax=Clandestinovirus TaxID=2831644 RepID=A0A8F8PQS1_9VIRU|nr:hypothetical protein KOM_12_114 [Clandestinovirus]